MVGVLPKKGVCPTINVRTCPVLALLRTIRDSLYMYSMYIYICISIYTYVYMYANTIYMYIYIFIYIQTCICVHVMNAFNSVNSAWPPTK